MGTLDSELLFAIIGLQFRMLRGGNTQKHHDEVILVSSAATGELCTQNSKLTHPLHNDILSEVLSSVPRPRGFDRSDSSPHL
jgi:hypothetical protein